MRRFPQHHRWACGGLFLCVLSLAAGGCGSSEKSAPAARPEVAVRVTSPRRRDIDQTVGQPAFVDAYEQTAIYPKIAGYVSNWKVDIGDRIKKNQVLAYLFVPELDAEYEEKKAELARDNILIEVARQMVDVAKNQLNVAIADVKKAESDIGKYQSAVERWESEVSRLTGLVAERVVDKQILDESQKQLKSNIAEREAAEAAVVAAQAVEASRQADLQKATVDVEAAQAKAKVAQAAEERFAALVSYTQLTSPYDGVVVVRNVNTGDFVQPAGGDKTNDRNTAGTAQHTNIPMYVVARTDTVRIFVDVPEMQANHVKAGTEARVQIQSLGGTELKGTVTRTSWSLNVQTRSLRAEIDLPNPDATLLPGMYAYAMVFIRRKDVMAVPQTAIIQKGNQTCFFLLDAGKVSQVPVQVGTTDGKWIEVTGKQIDGNWVSINGSERVVLGDLAELTSGQSVQVTSGEKTPVPSAASHR